MKTTRNQKSGPSSRSLESDIEASQMLRLCVCFFSWQTWDQLWPCWPVGGGSRGWCGSCSSPSSGAWSTGPSTGWSRDPTASTSTPWGTSRWTASGGAFKNPVRSSFSKCLGPVIYFLIKCSIPVVETTTTPLGDHTAVQGTLRGYVCSSSSCIIIHRHHFGTLLPPGLEITWICSRTKKIEKELVNNGSPPQKCRQTICFGFL